MTWPWKYEWFWIRLPEPTGSGTTGGHGIDGYLLVWVKTPSQVSSGGVLIKKAHRS